MTGQLPPLESGESGSLPSDPNPPDFGYASAPPPRKIVFLWKWSLAAAAVLALLVLWQCGSALYQGPALSNNAVWRFHTHLNNGEFGAICDEADVPLAQGEMRDELLDVLQGVHRKLGDAGEEKLVNLNVDITLSGTFLHTQYVTTFAQGNATENFTWRKSGETLKLYRYNVQSRAFIQ